MRFKQLIWMIFLVFFSQSIWGQLSSLRTKKIAYSTASIQFDTLSILPHSLVIRCGDAVLLPSYYQIDYAKARLVLNQKCIDSLSLTYRVLPISFAQMQQHRDTSQLYRVTKGNRDLFLIPPTDDPIDLMETAGLKKTGSIARGVSFGNKQDLSVNSNLNLELSGYIAPNLQILASVTDNNLPIQPEGNTNKLQEFDQVFVQLFNDQFKMTVGDFWLSKPEGYFMTYKKRGQGLTGEYTWKTKPTNTIKTQVSGALSKGKFNRQIITGIEGNQGPYRLRGNENEPFIVVLSGTERVFIDGKLMKRGQEFDYVIDYNTAEVTFTARNLMTKDIRIVIEFQYADQNYARSLFQFSTVGTTKKMDWWFNAYSEQDVKNQPLQQNLTDQQKGLLAAIGDSLELAQSFVIDSVGFSENLVMYQLVDSLGFDTVLVASINPTLAIYKVTFSYVGQGNGDYVFEKFNALGKVYKWLQPVGGIPQGDYAPVKMLITPKKQQLIALGGKYRFSDRLSLLTETAMSTTDKNTFSSKDKRDDKGFSFRAQLTHSVPFGKDTVKKWSWKNQLECELLDPFFKPIEQYRAVEFDRDWNTRNQHYEGNQIYTTFRTALKHQQYGSIEWNAQNFKIGNDFSGVKSQVLVAWYKNGLRIQGDGSMLSATTVASNRFFRHKVDVSKSYRWLKVGYKADQEWNAYKSATTLTTASYSFFDYQGYAVFGDSTSGEFRLSYRERLDGRSNLSQFATAAKAKTASIEWSKKNWKNQRLLLIGNYRVLAIVDSTLINQQPENTTNGRIDHEWRFAKNAVQLTTFYEVGAGLELKKAFIYIKVNDGQGVYTWVDYNGDNIKDLNEFEIAAYADQASYIRVFTPSNEYSKTYSNEFNQSLTIRPERLWASSNNRLKKQLARFSTQSRLRIQRKTAFFEGINAYNPFVGRIDNQDIISATTNMKHTVYFNRTSAVFSADYSYDVSQSKLLLATGYDGKYKASHSINGRYTFHKEWSVLQSFETGEKQSIVDYTTGRNYQLNYFIWKPSLVFQPSTTLRLSLDARYSKKQNAINLGGESATVKDIGCTVKYNQAQKGSLQVQLNVVQIDFIGNANSPLGFELLEALKAGKNAIWSVGYQRTISKSLQLAIQYSGRKSQLSPFVHAGGMELKAFF